MHIIVGSASERKILVCKTIFAHYFPGEVTAAGCPADSGVPPTPHDEETIAGARSRARHGRAAGAADFYVGLESGLVNRYGLLYEEAWACVLSAEGREFLGYSSGLRVPDRVVHAIREASKPHYEVMAQLEQERRLPHDTWFNYSGGVLPRRVSLEEAVRNAVIQALAPPGSLYHS